jgi:hypothetical protein
MRGDNAGHREERPVHIDGSCHCRAIQYTATIDPAQVSICHCTDCQILTGSPYRVSVLCAPDAVRVVSGQTRIYRKRGDSGRIRLQHFCGDCGAPLFACDEDPTSGIWSLRWGSIAQRSEMRPSRQIWCRSAVPWIGELAALPGQETE